MDDILRTQKINMDSISHKDLEATEEMSPLDLGGLNCCQKPIFQVSGLSHPGFLRKANEDSFGYFCDNQTESLMAVVADGIGGHGNGDIASSMTVKMLLSAWRDLISRETPSGQDAEDFFLRELQVINETVFDVNAKFALEYPMGTTVAAVAVLKDHVITAHAGDSRVYRLRDKQLEHLTHDHSIIWDLITSGKVKESEAANHPYAHVISKSIGPIRCILPEIHSFDKRPGDKLLICSDGLTLHLKHDELRNILSVVRSSREISKTLMNNSLRRGGCDNITVISICL